MLFTKHVYITTCINKKKENEVVTLILKTTIGEKNVKIKLYEVCISCNQILINIIQHKWINYLHVSV